MGAPAVISQGTVKASPARGRIAARCPAFSRQALFPSNRLARTTSVFSQTQDAQAIAMTTTVPAGWSTVKAGATLVQRLTHASTVLTRLLEAI